MLANYNQLRLYARKASNNRDPLFAWIEIEFENDNLQEMLYLGLTQDFDYIELNYSDSIYIRDRGWLEKSLTKTIIRNLAGFYSIISTNTPSFAKTLAAKLSNGENVGVRCSETFCLAPKLMVEELLGEALPIVDFPVLFKVSYGDYFENLRKFQFDKIKFYESDIFVSHLDLSYYMYSEVEDFKNECEGKSKRKPSKAKLHTLKAVLLATDVYLKTKADNFVDAKNKDDWINEQFKIYGDPYEEELNNLEDNKNEVQIYAIKIEKLEDKYRLLLKQQLDEIIKQLPKSRKKIYSQCHDHLLPDLPSFQRTV